MSDKNNSYSPKADSECSDRSSKCESTGPIPSSPSSKKSYSKRSETPNEPNQSRRSVSRSLSRQSRRSVSRSLSRQSRRSVSSSPPRKSRNSFSRSPPRNHNRGRDNRPVADPSKCIGVFGLSKSTNDDDLYDIFKKFGKISSVKLIMDRYHNESRGYGFINFDDLEAAKRAVKEISGMDLDGRKIRVDFSITKKAHTPTPGGYKGRNPGNQNENRNNDRYDNRRPRNYNRNDQCDRYGRNDRYERNDRYDRNDRHECYDKNDGYDRNDRYDNRQRGRKRDFSDRSRSRSSGRKRSKYD